MINHGIRKLRLQKLWVQVKARTGFNTLMLGTLRCYQLF